MTIFEFIAFFILGIYSIIIIGFTIGLTKLKVFERHKETAPIPVSIVVACRNEQDNIGLLLNSLIKQNYPKNKFEIIIVDDHSEDKTPEIIKNYISKFENIKLFNQIESKQGKKEAIALGIKKSSSDIIITTDADCQTNENWLSTMVSYYRKYQPKILSGFVVFKKSPGIFQKFQSLEFLSLVGSGAGAIGINKAIMNNGANLLFERSLFLESDQHNHFASGDDIFLMLHAKKLNKKSIRFIKSRDTIVYTQGINNLKDFFNQRIRWTSKSKAYRDFDIIFTAVIVTFTNLLLATKLIFSFWNINLFISYLIFFAIKSLVDLTILIPVSSFLNRQKLLWLFFPLQIIYPFYILLTVLLGLAGNFRWKNRSFKEKG